MKQLFIISIFVSFLFACSRNTIKVPTITEDNAGIYHFGKFVWHDLVTHDIAAARDFYANVFGWAYEGRGGDRAPYLTAMIDDKPIAGLVKSDRLIENVNEARWISYISAPDVEKSANLVLQNGGQLYTQVLELENRGIVVIAGDPGGAIFGIINATGGDPEDTPKVNNIWVWNELLSNDKQKVIPFYRAIFGYEIVPQGASESNKRSLLLFNKKIRAGLTKLPWTDVSPNWLPIIKVADITTIISRAQEHGGLLIIAPDDNIRSGSIAVLADPTGAVFGIEL